MGTGLGNLISEIASLSMSFSRLLPIFSLGLLFDLRGLGDAHEVMPFFPSPH
jgi:hypothetical protein